ncbi:1-deoxy-D-xylulose-5-phosphate synthase, partial [bacterium]
GTFDYSYLRHGPNITIMATRDAAAMRDVLATALSQEGPCAFRYPRGTGVGVPIDDPEVWDAGTGELLRAGGDIALVAVGVGVHFALEAAQELSRDGIEAAVIDARFIKPLDTDLIFKWGRECGTVLTVEENVLMGGFGSAVLEAAADNDEGFTIRRLGLPDAFIEQGSQAQLRADLGIDAAGIRHAVLEILKDVKT